MSRQEHIHYAESKKTYTNSFRRYALELSKIGTIQDVANHLQVSWDVVKEIQKEYLEAHYGNPDIKNVQRIGYFCPSPRKGKFSLKNPYYGCKCRSGSKVRWHYVSHTYLVI